MGKVEINLSERAISIIERLVETQIYGKDKSEVCERLLYKHIEQMLINQDLPKLLNYQ